MRKTIFALAVVAALTTPAYAQVDHVREGVTAPACLTPFHLHEAEALMRAHRPINENVCIMLTGGSEVVMVGDDIYTPQQIAYQVNGKTLSLFMNKGALGDWMVERAAHAAQDKQDEQAEDAFMKTVVGGSSYARLNLRRAWSSARSCHRAVWHPSYVRPCDRNDDDLRKELANIKENADGLNGLQEETDAMKASVKEAAGRRAAAAALKVKEEGELRDRLAGKVKETDGRRAKPCIPIMYPGANHEMCE